MIDLLTQFNELPEPEKVEYRLGIFFNSQFYGDSDEENQRAQQRAWTVVLTAAKGDDVEFTSPVELRELLGRCAQAAIAEATRIDRYYGLVRETPLSDPRYRAAWRDRMVAYEDLCLDFFEELESLLPQAARHTLGKLLQSCNLL
ncbi:MAG: hypothetical protein AB7O52_17960 [Planctomycetota bacterium]